jgi:hypothetical protein
MSQGADMTDEQDWLKLQVGGPQKPVDADAFIGIFENTIAALKAIDRGFSSHGSETIQWELVGAGSNSPIYAMIRGRDRISHDGMAGRKIADAFTAGIEQLGRESACPAGFGKESLRYVQRIVSAAKAHGLRPVYFTVAREVRITRKVAVNANRARRVLEMRKSRLVEHGTIEGRLRDLSESHSRDKIGILDRLTGEVTRCYLRDESLECKALQGWKHRVAVTGQITVDRQSGRPVQVEVDEIRILPDRNDLPQIEDLNGIDITNGVEPSEYVRRLRDAE